MPRFTLLILSILSLVGSANLHAQDLFGSTGSTTRSYSYVEAQWLTNLDTDGVPLRANILVAITDSISISGEYFSQSGVVPFLGTDVEIEVEQISAGLVYHRPFTFIENSDWVVGLSLGQVRANLRAANADRSVSVKTEDPIQQLYVGIRRSIVDKLEGEVGINVVRSEEDTSAVGSVRFVYRVLPAIDIALALNDIGADDDRQDNLLGIGLRYTW